MVPTEITPSTAVAHQFHLFVGLVAITAVVRRGQSGAGMYVYLHTICCTVRTLSSLPETKN